MAAPMKKKMFAMATNYQLRWLRDTALQQPRIDCFLIHNQIIQMGISVLFRWAIFFRTNFSKQYKVPINCFSTVESKKYNKMRPFINDFYIEIMEIIAIMLVSDAQFFGNTIQYCWLLPSSKKNSELKKTLIDDCLKFTRNIHAASFLFCSEIYYYNVFVYSLTSFIPID